MSTQNTEAETDNTSTDASNADKSTDFSVGAVRGRLSGTLTGKQERVGVCLVRNPDAPLTGISDKAGVSPTTVHNTLKALVNERGLDETDAAEAFARRGGPKRAESYHELTEKQKAVVDWAARNPGTRERLNDPDDSLTSEKVSLAIEHDERYDVALHSTYPNKVLKPATYEHAGGYNALVDERRETLAAKGELDEEAEAEVAETLRTKPPRALLAAAGWDLPESNRDSLDKAEELTEQEILDKAWEASQNEGGEEPVTEADRREHSAPYSCPECGNEGNEDFCGTCGADKRYEWAKEDEAAAEDGAGGDEGDSADEDEDAEADEDRIDLLEDYWRAVDLCRYLRDLMRQSPVTKEEVHEEPLVREYHLAVSRKCDVKEDVEFEDGTPGLPVYRDEHETPAWDHRIEELSIDGEAFVPVDYSVPDTDRSEELGAPLVQDAGELEDALAGVNERLNDLGDSVDTLRESAVHESELEEALGNVEERTQSALDEHKEAVNREVDERLRNSVKRETLDRVAELEERVRAVGAAEESTPEGPRVMADGHLDANTRLSLVLNELVELAESGGEVTSMEVTNRRHGKSREYVISVSEDGESGPHMARDESAGEGED
jgi:DNA-binding MarR family transcriptional regulator